MANNQKPLHLGQIVTVSGGKYDRHGGQVKKIHAAHVELLISGRIVKLKKERVPCG